jgi:hypothetical protein
MYPIILSISCLFLVVVLFICLSVCVYSMLYVWYGMEWKRPSQSKERRNQSSVRNSAVEKKRKSLWQVSSATVIALTKESIDIQRLACWSKVLSAWKNAALWFLCVLFRL